MTKIVQSKTILGGKARISGTRISVDVVGNYITNGLGVAEIRKDYPHLSDNQIKTALSYIKRRTSKEMRILEPTTN